MKIFTEKALKKYVDEKVQRIRDWDNYVRDIDRLSSENYKLAERGTLRKSLKRRDIPLSRQT